MLTYSLQTHELLKLMDFLLWSSPWDSPQQDRFLCGFWVFFFFWRDRNHKCYKQFRQSEMARKPLENSSGQPITTGENVWLISLIKISAGLISFMSLVFLAEVVRRWSAGAHPTWVLVLLQPKSRPLSVSPRSPSSYLIPTGGKLDHIWVWELNLFW